MQKPSSASYERKRPHTGHRFVTVEILSRHLPSGYRRFQYFICGPGPMMDAVESALIELDVPGERVHTERFDMV